MKYELIFRTSEEEGDGIVDTLQNTMLYASSIEVIKSDNGKVLSSKTVPVISSEVIIDAEIVSDKPKEEVIVMVGSNIDEVLDERSKHA